MVDRSLRIPAWHVPEVLDDSETFDAVVMPAVVEHVPADIRRTWASSILCLLRLGGRLIITVPAPVVDRILILESAYGYSMARRPNSMMDWIPA